MERCNCESCKRLKASIEAGERLEAYMLPEDVSRADQAALLRRIYEDELFDWSWDDYNGVNFVFPDDTPRATMMVYWAHFDVWPRLYALTDPGYQESNFWGF